jgi:hypothetical protein
MRGEGAKRERTYQVALHRILQLRYPTVARLRQVAEEALTNGGELTDRLCIHCGKVKPVDEFSKDRRNYAGGVSTTCLDCKRDRDNARWARNRKESAGDDHRREQQPGRAAG